MNGLSISLDNTGLLLPKAPHTETSNVGACECRDVASRWRGLCFRFLFQNLCACVRERDRQRRGRRDTITLKGFQKNRRVQWSEVLACKKNKEMLFPLQNYPSPYLPTSDISSLPMMSLLHSEPVKAQSPSCKCVPSAPAVGIKHLGRQCNDTL